MNGSKWRTQVAFYTLVDAGSGEEKADLAIRQNLLLFTWVTGMARSHALPDYKWECRTLVASGQ